MVATRAREIMQQLLCNLVSDEEASFQEPLCHRCSSPLFLPLPMTQASAIPLPIITASIVPIISRLLGFVSTATSGCGCGGDRGEVGLEPQDGLRQQTTASG